MKVFTSKLLIFGISIGKSDIKVKIKENASRHITVHNAINIFAFDKLALKVQSPIMEDKDTLLFQCRPKLPLDGVSIVSHKLKSNVYARAKVKSLKTKEFFKG